MNDSCQTDLFEEVFNPNSTPLLKLRDLPGQGGGANIAPPPTIFKSSTLTKKNLSKHVFYN